VSTHHDELGIQSDAARDPHAEAADGFLDVLFGLLRSAREVRLLQQG
jgi:hypothetical protein